MKELIYCEKNKLSPVGGPYGYLYNLYCGLQMISNNEIYFLNNNARDKSNRKQKPNYNKFTSTIKKRIWPYYFIMSLLFGFGKSKEKLDNYNVVHYHTTVDLYKCRRSLKKYKGYILLTSHSPEAWHLEASELVKKLHMPFKKSIIKKIEKIDEYAFENCNFVVFPCREAMEPYLHTWRYFADHYDEIIKKAKFILTGINKPSKIIPENLDISFNNKFKVCFVGRHNEIKGYDILLNAAKILNRQEDIQFIIAGREGPIYHSSDLKNWKELGWTNNPLGVIKSCDIFVLPNRETYFDIVLLEALSIPTVVLISDSGGNKYFKKFDSNAITYFETGNAHDLANKICQLKEQKKTFDSRREEASDIFEANFTSKVFADNYLNLIRSIYLGNTI